MSYNIRLEVRKMAKDLMSNSSVERKLQLALRRQQLISDIEAFNSGARRYIHPPPTDLDDACLDDDLDIQDAEDMALYLPSSLGFTMLSMSPMHRIAQKEMELRCGQANDALHELRLDIGYTSFLYRTSVRTADSQQTKTRASSMLQSAEKNRSKHAMIYSSARSALGVLQAPKDIMDQYRNLADEDMVANTAIIDPRVTNASKTKLSWIFTIGGQGNTSNTSWMSECGSFKYAGPLPTMEFSSRFT